MSNASDLFGGGGGGKPKRITVLTFGTGTYIPLEDNAIARVRVQAGGSAGSTDFGGGAGAMVELMIRIPVSGLPYAVAASATSGGGSFSYFGSATAAPGDGVSGGSLGTGAIYASGSIATSISIGGQCGVAGGGINFTSRTPLAAGYTVAPAGSLTLSGRASGAGGGDSFFGVGGNGNESGPGGSGGIGAGGGCGSTVGGAGGRGHIEIWEY